MHDGLQKLASISRRASDWPGQHALGKKAQQNEEFVVYEPGTNFVRSL